MDTNVVAIVGFVALFGLMLLRVPVGMAMGLVGVTGRYIVGSTPAIKMIGQTSMRTVTDFNSPSSRCFSSWVVRHDVGMSSNLFAPPTPS
jgi:hypothetical protein